MKTSSTHDSTNERTDPAREGNPKSPGVRGVHRCRSCAATIGIDPFVMLDRLPPSASFPDYDLAAACPPFVVLEPGPARGGPGSGTTNGPCEHMVSLYLDVSLSMPDSAAAVRTPAAARPARIAFSVEWDHPWFAREDPDKNLQVVLWTEWSGSAEADAEARRYAAGRFRRDRAYVRRPVPGTPWTLEYIGEFILSPDSATFLAGLPGCAVRMQEARMQEAREQAKRG